MGIPFLAVAWNSFYIVVRGPIIRKPATIRRIVTLFIGTRDFQKGVDVQRATPDLKLTWYEIARPSGSK